MEVAIIYLFIYSHIYLLIDNQCIVIFLCNKKKKQLTCHSEGCFNTGSCAFAVSYGALVNALVANF